MASLPALAFDGRVAGLPDKTPGAYLVLMGGDPVVAYTGHIPGLAATAVSPVQELRRESPAVTAYAAHLRSRHDEALRSAGVSPEAKLYDYTFALDGFAAVLTAAEAAALSRRPEVRAVVRDEMRTPATDSTPDFLGLTDPRGPWATGYTGEGVVIGVIDTGIWPEHASFAPASATASPPDGFHGTACDFGEAVPGALAHNGADATFTCGGKIVSAEAFAAGFTAHPDRSVAASEFLTARDAAGHGTHAAAVAAGNQGVAAGLVSSGLPVTMSGVAPRARIAAYKACWTADSGEVGCAISDLVAAIDQAIADGVDVISYAVGSAAAVIGPDDLAFMYATAAGVLVAAPAGNAGPAAGTVRSPGTAPWVTTVAAVSDDRAFRGTLVLGDGTSIEGAGTSAGTGSLPLLDAADLGNATCDPAGSFDASIAGAIVLCAESDLAPPAISRAVAEAGGAAVVTAAGLGDTRAVVTGGAVLPLLSVDPASASRIGVYVAESGGAAVATLGEGIPTAITGSVVGSFSARGPNPLAPDILKPDVAAPGVAIVAATPPRGGTAEAFTALSGTSPAAAHVAGVYALLRQAHPTWSAAATKSALVTTTRRDVWTDRDLTPADALSAGAGLIQPGGAITRRGTPFNPGLVYEAPLEDDVAFLCGLGGEIGGTVDCRGAFVDARDLNQPAIGLADVVGTSTVMRTVTSVADKTRVFEAHVDAPPGFFVEVDPVRITLAPGESARFAITVTPTRAPSGEWRQGSLTWVSDDYRISSPIVARAAAIAAPAQVTGAGAAGTATFDVSFGYSGGYEAVAHGLAAPTVTEAAVAADPGGDVASALESGIGATATNLAVGEGTVLVRIALSGEVGDIDLYVFDEDGGLAGRSTSSGAREDVDLTLPAAGDYTVVVHGSHVVGAEAAYTLSTWLIGGDAEASLELVRSPGEATQNGQGTVSVAWPEAPGGTELVGAVTHADDSGAFAVTAITVDPSETGTTGPLGSDDR